MATIVTSKGQVTIPIAADSLGIRPGNAVEFDLAPDGCVVLRKLDGEPPQSRFEEWRGAAGPGFSSDEIIAMMRDEVEDRPSSIQTSCSRFFMNDPVGADWSIAEPEAPPSAAPS